MTDLNEMWRELEQYQPFADRHGFGKAWKRMCEERTDYAAYAAAYVAAHAASRSNRADRWLAANAAEYAGDVAAEVDGEWSQIAIENIREAIAKEEP